MHVERTAPPPPHRRCARRDRVHPVDQPSILFVSLLRDPRIAPRLTFPAEKLIPFSSPYLRRARQEPARDIFTPSDREKKNLPRASLRNREIVKS